MQVEQGTGRKVGGSADRHVKQIVFDGTVGRRDEGLGRAREESDRRSGIVVHDVRRRGRIGG